MERPSRRTEMRSPTCRNSSNRCEMYTIPIPRACRVLMREKSRSISVFERLAVGSSMMRIFDSYESAFAISTICWCAVAGLPRAGEAHGSALEGDCALIRRNDASEDLHQRAFACSVFTHQNVNFPP